MEEKIGKISTDDLVEEQKTALDELVVLNVNESDVDIEKYYKEIEDLRIERDDLKRNEADNIIEELGPKYIDTHHADKLKTAKEQLRNWIKKYDVNSEYIIDATSEERDKIYGIVQFVKNYYLNTIDNLMFSFEITDKEYKFLRKALRDEMEYDGVEVFNIIELYTNYISVWDQMYKELGGGFTAPIDIKNVVMLYHFLSKYKVKGLHDSFRHFTTILTKIADMNKVFNAFNVVKERINTDFMIWAGAISSDYVDETLTEEDLRGSAASDPMQKIDKMEKAIDTLTNVVGKLADKE
jgi:hypothetical protein